MDIKYNISKLKNSKLEEIKDAVSVEEPLEMTFKNLKKIITLVFSEVY